MNPNTYRCRFEDCIISTIHDGRQVFSFLNTGWDLKADAKHLVEVLELSIRQIRANLYYGRYSLQTIENAIQYLKAA